MHGRDLFVCSCLIRHGVPCVKDSCILSRGMGTRARVWVHFERCIVSGQIGQRKVLYM